MRLIWNVAMVMALALCVQGLILSSGLLSGLPDLPEKAKKALLQRLQSNLGDLEMAAEEGGARGVEQLEVEERRFRGKEQVQEQGANVRQGSAAFIHSQFSRPRAFQNYDRRMEKAGVYFTQAFNALIKKLKLTPQEIRWLVQLRYGPKRGKYSEEAILILTKVLGKRRGEICPAAFRNIKCKLEDFYFRRFDGSCNNWNNPTFGMAGQPFERFLPPIYDDGVDAPKQTSLVSNRPLPNVRDISLKLYPRSTDTDLDDRISHFVMQWGQFLDHDLTLAPMIQPQEPGEGIACCAEDLEENDGLSPEELAQINIELASRPECVSFSIDPIKDTAFRGRTCHPLVRSAPAPQPGCYVGPREQFNILTAYIDGSQIYGSSDEEAEELREHKDGKLAEQQISRFRRPFPPSRSANETCEVDEGQRCFLAGDERINEHPGLATSHIIWLREHNRIAKYLKVNSQSLKSDEEIFQQTRRIVIAELQMITFGEFLPVLLDKEVIKEHGLELQKRGNHFRGYDPSINAAIRNEFATAAYRMGHTLIRSTFSRLVGRRQFPPLTLSEHFERVEEVVNPDTLGPESIAQGLLHDPAQAFDRSATTEIVDRLFANLAIGLDLFSMNEQRGREHGIAPYVHFREFCGLSVPKDFDDLVDHDEGSREALKDSYEHAEDIDFFAGGISETLNRGTGIVGPTFQCLLALQFHISKVGDRFYFEMDNQRSRFTRQQLNEIREKVTLSAVLCDNVSGLSRVQKQAFFQASRSNPLTPCRNIDRLNLNLFLDHSSSD